MSSGINIYSNNKAAGAYLIAANRLSPRTHTQKLRDSQIQDLCNRISAIFNFHVFQKIQTFFGFTPAPRQQRPELTTESDFPYVGNIVAYDKKSSTNYMETQSYGTSKAKSVEVDPSKDWAPVGSNQE